MDVTLRQRLWDSIRALNDAGVTIVLTTHYLEEAEALCDQIAIINKGEIIAACSKAELLASAGQKTLYLTVAGGVTMPLPPALTVLGATWRDGRLAISFDPNITNAISLIQQVSAAGLEIRDISTAEPDLEDVFLRLTGIPKNTVEIPRWDLVLALATRRYRKTASEHDAAFSLPAMMPMHS